MARWLRPPEALGRPGPRMRRWLGAAWWLLLIIAIVAQAGGSWRAWVELDALASGAEGSAELIAIFHALSALLALPFLAGAVLLRRRAACDPVAWLLSFAFLAFAASLIAPLAFWDWLGLEDVGVGLMALWFALLMLALPLFPDGRFVPPRTRWLLVAVPVAALLSMTELLEAATAIAFLIIFAIGLHAIAHRYRRTPPGPARQQMKWAAFGLFAGVGSLLAAGMAVLIAIGLDLAETAMTLVGVAAILIAYLGLLLMPLGIILSMFRYRLNDADAAIGRSAGYALVTLAVGVVWAVCMSWTNQLIGHAVGGGTAMATGLSTLAAALVFVPARERLLGWTERRFQPALVRLRHLPERLDLLCHGDDPAEVARDALPRIVEGVGADSAALIDAQGAVLAAVGDPGAGEWRIELGGAGALLVGPRSDGASYSRDERAALHRLAGPLAEALEITSRRAERRVGIERALAALDARLAALEGVARPAR